MPDTIAENLELVYERIRQAARKSGRDTEDITLVCAAKTFESKHIKKAIAGGARVFGENYVQEAEEKISKVRDKSVRWHLIGHLQKNKVRKAVELFDLIESVDSLKLAELINKRTEKPMDVLIQVNIAGEDSKHGVPPQDVVELARGISGLEKLNLRGLMAIPPLGRAPEASRPYFITLRRLAERVNREIPGLLLSDLSMGMSTDFDVAIEEGATMVRVGRAIFGEREEEPGKAPAKKKAAPKKAAETKKKAPAGKKTPAKKTAESKKTTKKAAPKKKAAGKAGPAKKATAGKKSTAKKTTAGKTEPKKTAKKAAPKKTTSAKKTTATKKATAAKKATPRKPAAKKTTTKKTTAKKSTAKKTTAKKTSSAKKATKKK